MKYKIDSYQIDLNDTHALCFGNIPRRKKSAIYFYNKKNPEIIPIAYFKDRYSCSGFVKLMEKLLANESTESFFNNPW